MGFEDWMYEEGYTDPEEFLDELISDSINTYEQLIEGKEIDQSLFIIRKLECPKCKSSVSLKEGRFGYFWGCANYPSCRFTIDIKHNDILINHCPSCDSNLVIRNSRNGFFIGCTSFPNCRFSTDLKLYLGK